ncbi:phytanoyl-CoA dioxygenase family protein [Streptomyces sp. NPDC060006]|uniref:phytanoyl-CoA dioxygenase family protein n=1 Tax=unclassified Streptomyces TaxID=2593676 RepID=UPI00368B4D97
MTNTLSLARQGTLSDEDVARYRDQGFIHVPQLLSGEETAGFMAAATDLLDHQEKASWDEEGGNVMDWVMEPENKSEAMRLLALHPRITAIAEQLAGVSLRMFKSELLLKRKVGSSPTPPHVDDVALPFTGRPVTLTAWVALTDVPVERGCMSFLPGTHQRPAVPTSGTAADWTPFAGEPELVWEPRVTVPLRAGDCTFHHARIVHMAGDNHGDADRVSLTTVYMDDEAVFRVCPIAEFADDLGGMEPGQRLSGDRFPRADTYRTQETEAHS